MDEVTLEMSIFTTRWGHADIYDLEFGEEALTISHPPRTATCTWREGLDPEWSKESITEKDSLLAMLENDSVFPPTILHFLLERAWFAWRDGDIEADDLQLELNNLAVWLNVITHTRPQSEFWRGFA